MKEMGKNRLSGTSGEVSSVLFGHSPSLSSFCANPLPTSFTSSANLATHDLQIPAVTLTDRRREQDHLPWQMSHPIADDAHELILLLNKGKVTTLLKNDQFGARDAPMEAFCTQRWRRNPVVLTTKHQRRR
jgi:hypothetical protein